MFERVKFRSLHARRRYRLPMLALGGILTATAGGCSKEQLDEAMAKAKEQTQSLTKQAADAVEQPLPETGSVSIRLAAGEIAIGDATATLFRFADGRRGLIRVTHRDTGTGPSILLQGRTGAASAGDVRGTVPCDLLIDDRTTGPTAMAMTEEGPIDVTFASSGDGVLRITIPPSKLAAADGSPFAVNGGAITAVIGETVADTPGVDSGGVGR